MSVLELIGVTFLLYSGVWFLFAFAYRPKGPDGVVLTGEPFYFDNPDWAPKPQD